MELSSSNTKKLLLLSEKKKVFLTFWKTELFKKTFISGEHLLSSKN